MGKGNKKLKITIGDIRISVTSNSRFKIDDIYRLFLSQGRARPEVILGTHYGSIPQIELGKKIFNTQILNLYRNSKKIILHIPNPKPRSSSMEKLGVFKPDFKSGDIYARNEILQNGFPLNYPIGQILMINLLSLNRGALIHACGVSEGGQGILFVGSSGAGKSTMANLWKKKEDVVILSDDRIIIRKMGKRFWIYGTPWHGDVKACSPEAIPLEKIFFLRHAKKNTIKKITLIDVASRLIVCSFPTFWDKKGMKFTLRFCAELAQKVPCYELGFVPDESMLSFVKE